jgi:hypothetical protein
MASLLATQRSPNGASLPERCAPADRCFAGQLVSLPYIVLFGPVVVAAAAAALAASPVPLQPFAQQVRALESALDHLGEPLSQEEKRRINDAVGLADEAKAAAELERLLDARALAVVEINPESRVKVTQGKAPPRLAQGGTRAFLVKVVNQAGVTAALAVESPNTGAVYTSSFASGGSPSPPVKLTAVDVRERWADIGLYTKPPMRERLSGLPLEYAILLVGSRDAGQRSAKLGFNVGQGTQDIGYRSETLILFDSAPAFPVTLRVRDEKGRPTVAAFEIRDRLLRLYPLPAKRLAPDLPFQPQVYRADGDVVLLPAGDYSVTCSRGPEYMSETKPLAVKAKTELRFALSRWIDPSKLGWYSGDHHIHAAGCSHYDNPTQGVTPTDMWLQVQGEALNVGSVLTWGPCYYHQKQFFSGQDHPLSTADHLLHYDLEVSGFPSSHAGHLVLLGLKDQDYPGTKRIEDWPSWDLPVLRWAKAQAAVTGFAHSGWGLAVNSSALPNYEIPAFDGIGANEYIVDVTHPGLVDFISAGDTSYPSELNIWYHTLNVGYRTRISGETDFPCITDDKVGLARSYAKLEGGLSYRGFVEAVRTGRTYVSDGKSHLIDFALDNVAVGERDSEVKLEAPRTLRATVKVAALLDALPEPEFRNLKASEKPYWDIRRARIGASREVAVELVVNGEAVQRKNVAADGSLRELGFDVEIARSSWVALRILPSSHTNPVFVLVGGKPIRASRRSAQWCLDGVNQCWTQKRTRIRGAELEEAERAYEHARQTYRRLLAESDPP